jgi:hypothetical protein
MSDLFPDAPQQVSLDDQIACVKREIGFREHVYPRRIKASQMTQALADRELGRMRAVLHTLEKVKAGAEPPSASAELIAQREATLVKAHGHVDEHLALIIAKGGDAAQTARLAHWGVNTLLNWARVGIRVDRSGRT